MVELVEEYSIPFPIYLDKKSYLRVAEDEMLLHKYDFNETVELICSNLSSLSFSSSFGDEFSLPHFVIMPPFFHVVTAI